MSDRSPASAASTLAASAVPLWRWVAPQPGGLSRRQFARLVAHRLAWLSAVVLPVIWALTGRGTFWPGWAWLGLGTPVLLDLALRWPARFQTPAARRVALLWALIGVTTVVILATWQLTHALADVGEFWPQWPLFGLITAGVAYSVLTLHDRVLVAQGRRALRQRIDLLTRTRSQAIDAQAAELHRIERDLHDGAQARLVALMLHLGRVEMRLDADPELQGMVGDAQREAQAAIAELRTVARGIVPPLLLDRGLEAAVRALAARYGLGTEVSVALDRRLPEATERAAYFVVAEGLTNTAKHAGARHSWVALTVEDDTLVARVGDDGCGGAQAGAPGLAGLRARVEALDGRVDVTSPRGGGTTIEARLPCAS